LVTRITTYDYEQSSEGGRERMVRMPYANLCDVTPTLHDPAMVVDSVLGSELTGTVISLDAVDSIAVLNVASGAVFRHNVRNVLTYTPAETTWRALNIGDTVYYDDSGIMPAYTKLSISPLDSAGNANPRFGWIVMIQDEDSGDFAKGNAQAGSTHACAVLQG